MHNNVAVVQQNKTWKKIEQFLKKKGEPKHKKEANETTKPVKCIKERMNLISSYLFNLKLRTRAIGLHAM